MHVSGVSCPTFGDVFPVFFETGDGRGFLGDEDVCHNQEHKRYEADAANGPKETWYDVVLKLDAAGEYE